MSADDFSKLNSQLNPAGTAFNERLQAAQREFAQLQAIEKELKTDDARFNQQLQTLRQTLESQSKSLTNLHAKRSRLAKELAACDEEIAKLDAQKAETSKAIHDKTANQASNREKKLRHLEGKVPGGKTAAPATPPPVMQPNAAPVVDLLGEPTAPAPAPAVAAANTSSSGPADLLGLDDPPSSNPLDLLMTSGLGGAPQPPSMPPPTMMPPPPPQPQMSGGGGGFDDAFGGFDVSDNSKPASSSNPFDQPPAGMLGSMVAPPMGMMGAPPPQHSGQPQQMLGANMFSSSSMGAAAAGKPPAKAADPFAGLSGF